MMALEKMPDEIVFDNFLKKLEIYCEKFEIANIKNLIKENIEGFKITILLNKLFWTLGLFIINKFRLYIFWEPFFLIKSHPIIWSNKITKTIILFSKPCTPPRK